MIKSQRGKKQQHSNLQSYPQLDFQQISQQKLKRPGESRMTYNQALHNKVLVNDGLQAQWL